MQIMKDQAHSLADLLAILRCTTCRGTLETHDNRYVCRACKHSYPIEGDVVRFVPPQNYAGSFGFQWQRYARTQLDDASSRESERDLLRKTGFSPENLCGKLVLDVGCGMGRFAEVATRWGARVVGVDLSAAAEVAARNLADRRFAALQADVFCLPFVSESFDYIYSIGVLHHTPDCEQALKALPQYLNPWYRFSEIYRKLTSRIPPSKLHAFLRVAVPVINSVDGGLRVLPGVGKPLSAILRHVLPVNRNPNRQWRVLDTFDWYSPKYQSKHTYEQVFRWFEDCGLVDLHVGAVPIAVRGRKPGRPGGSGPGGV